MDVKDTSVRELRAAILAWYRTSARPFPWRVAVPDPYMVFVSEVMLQQTQAARVAQRLPLFLMEFPTIHALAAASNGTIIRAWQGMGYNSRALRLRDAASMIVDRYDGVVPDDPAVLRTLPGIGAYASASIACFAYNKRTVVLDVNIRRVYSRLMHRMTTTADVLSDAALTTFAALAIPPRNPSRWHNAVMEMGALICTARSPQCTTCPLHERCPSASQMTEARRVKRTEPLFRGEPQRLWRGRVIEALRQLPRGEDRSIRGIMDHVIGRNAEAEERTWFRALLSRLEADNLIVISNNAVRLHD